MDEKEIIKEPEVAELNSSEEEKKKKKRRSALKYALNISVVLIATVVAIVITLSDNFYKIIDNLASADWIWLLVTFGFMLAAMVARAFSLFCFARLFTRKYHFHQAVAVDMIGVFYNAVTPGASGGQPMQAYTFKKQGIPISSAVSMLAMHSIVYQIMLIIYGIVAFAVKYDLINQIGIIHVGQIGNWNIDLSVWVLTILGFGLNVGMIGITLLMGYWKGFHNFVMGPIINLLHKIKLCKNPDKTRENLRVQVENFKIEMRRLFTNIPFTLLISVIETFYIGLKFIIPFFIGKALGNESTSATWFDAILLGNYHQMITGLIPIPGSAGVSEVFFRLLFVNNSTSAISPSNSFFFKTATETEVLSVIEKMIASEGNEWSGATIEAFKENEAWVEIAVNSANKTASASLANAALLLWRAITFIIPLIISGFVSAFYRAAPKEESYEHGADHKTFVDLQQQTMATRQEELETLLETSQLNRERILSKLRSYKKDKNKDKEEKFDHVNIDDEDDSI